MYKLPKKWTPIKEYCNCASCELRHGCRNPQISGEATTDDLSKVELVFIGEAPGEDEDKLARPFVGRTGVLLRKLIREAGLRFFETAFLNAVNCRPPKNKTPSAKQIEACRMNLTGRLHQVPNVRLIVCLGKTAAKSLLSTSESVLSLRTKPLEWQGIPVLVTYHPAASFRQGDILRQIWQDLSRVGLLIGQKQIWKITDSTFVEPAWKSLEESMAGWPDTLSLDIETTGLTLEKDKVISLAIGFGQSSAVFFLKEKKHSWNTLKKKLMFKPYPHKTTIIGHNMTFDMAFLRKVEGLDLTDYTWFDTRVAYSLLYPEQIQTSLKVIGPVLTRIPYPMETMETIENYLKTGVWETLQYYNGLDVMITYRLYSILKYELIRQNKQKILEYLMHIAKLAAIMQSQGICINKTELMNKVKNLETQIIKNHEWLTKELEKKGFSPNVNSTKNIMKYLFSEKGLNLTSKYFTSKTGQPSLKAAHLKELPDSTGWIEKYLQWSQDRKFLKTYLSKLVEKVADTKDNVIYPTYNIIKSEEGGTVTGRITMTNPPIQTFPKEYLGLITSRYGKEGKIIKADLSQIELRVAAMLSGDKAMREAYSRGKDLHRQTAAGIFGVKEDEVTDAQRKVGKTVNFATIYLCSPGKLQEILREKAEVDITFKQAKTFLRNYYNTYPKISQWQKSILKELQEKGCVTSAVGRVRYFDNMDKDPKKAAVNFPIQSAAADIATWGMYCLWRRLKDEKLDKEVFLVANIYDAILVDTPLCCEEQVIKLIKEVYHDSKLMEEWGWKFSVPVRIDIEE